MINRVLIRIKVVQMVYAYYQSDTKDLAKAEKEFFHSIEKACDLYHYLLKLILAVTNYAEQRMDAARNKYIPTELEKNPNCRFVENAFVAQLAKNNDPELKLFEKYLDETSYIGEIGLDFSKEFSGTQDVQIDSLRSILSLVRNKKKLVSVHSRKAERILLQLLREYEIQNVIWHWYSGPLSLIPQIESLGHYFSVNEAMTKSIKGKKIIQHISRERLLTESDAPYNKVNNITNALLNIGLDASSIQENYFRLLSAIR